MGFPRESKISLAWILRIDMVTFCGETQFISPINHNAALDHSFKESLLRICGLERIDTRYTWDARMLPRVRKACWAQLCRASNPTSPVPVLLSKERLVMCARENQKQLERLMCCWHAELVELRQYEVGYCQ